VLAQHYGDGAVWAFNDVDSLASATTRHVPGFPLRTHGEVHNACRIADLESDGVLDLVMADNAGYLFAAKLDAGTAYEQPWTGPWGNNWNTGSQVYRDAGNAGHLYEAWTAPNGSRPPYRWFETGFFNSLTASGNTFTHDNGVLRTTTLNARNYHFTGPGMENLSNYTVRGTFKFDTDDAEFGINFYSQWPHEAKKYTLMREQDGMLRLYYYDGTTRTQIGPELDTSDAGANNDAPLQTNVWYNYEIRVNRTALDTSIRAYCWRDHKPSQPGIEQFARHLSGGLVGFVAERNAGTKYWGPITVTSNDQPTRATITVEDFHKDSLADVVPHISENWHPDYRFSRFELAAEVNGFVMDTTTGQPPALTYSHKPGVEYPVTCRLIPQTNLQWKDYRFSGTIVKPNQPAWDTVSVGIVFHYKSADSCYKVLFERDGVYLHGGLWKHERRHGLTFGRGDTLYYDVTVRSNSVGTVADSLIEVRALARLGVTGQWVEVVSRLSDDSKMRLQAGVPAVLVDARPVEETRRGSLLPLRVLNADLKKVR
jgi:hypothetical protein